MRNSWLESQTPEARATELLRRDIANKKKILANKDNMVKLLDLDQSVIVDYTKQPQAAQAEPQINDQMIMRNK